MFWFAVMRRLLFSERAGSIKRNEKGDFCWFMNYAAQGSFGAR